MQTPQDVLAYWLDELGPEGWYKGGEDLDDEIQDRFLTTWNGAQEGACGLWLTYPSGVLAYVILMDQFPRNMFRGTRKAFASDMAALTAAKIAIGKEWDLRIDEPARQFFYLPLMHSEMLTDQDRAVRLIHSRLPETGASNLLHAKAHREVIRTYGRFPYRNAALGRNDTLAELSYLKDGGYGATVRQLQGVPAQA